MVMLLLLPDKAQDSSKGVQWKQGVVTYMILHTSLLYSTTPINCTHLPLHPRVMNTQTDKALPTRWIVMVVCDVIYVLSFAVDYMIV